MSSPEHCRHCEDGCRGGTPIPAWPTPQPHINDDGAEWPNDCCPACAEAELIAAYLRDAAVRKRATLYAAADVVAYGVRKRPTAARGDQ